jgi:hypothetical protein
MNEDNETTFDGNEIVDYLLGTASAELTERFDELSITNDDFAEALAAAEADLVDQYVNGELSAAERASFERHYMRNRSSLSKLSFAEAFRKFGSRQARDGRPAIRNDQRSETDGFFISLIRYLRWGFAAAAAALLLFVVWLYFGANSSGDELSRNLNSQIGTPLPANNANALVEEKQPEIAQTTNEKPANESTQNNAGLTPRNTKPTPTEQSTIGRVFAFALSAPLRSSNSAPEIALPKETSRVSVRLELETDEFSTYNVKLIGPSNREMWRANSLSPVNGRSGAAIVANLDGALLRGGVYRFSVAGVRANGELEIIGDYPFRIVQ